MQNALDKNVLDELLSFASDGDPDLLLDLIQMFLDDSPSKVSAVREGLEAGDFEKAERAAHSLKASSGNLGARIVQDICEQLQVLTRGRKMNESLELAPRLEQSYAAAASELQKLRAVYAERL
jgi:HPt (histidine-containing phosphotransfer) domain-containing protein